MVVCLDNFDTIGKPVSIVELEKTILQIVSEIDCNCLALSGGLDSSLLLWFMLQVHDTVNTFTIGSKDNHPDVKHSKIAAKFFGSRVSHRVHVLDNALSREGPDAVRTFYKFVSDYTDKIISGDGIDEYTCGYYDHQKSPNEETYYKHLRVLAENHLIPLDKNSGNVDVFLPYLDPRLLLLLTQIPLREKVTEQQRKIVMVKLAEGKIPETIITRRKYGFCSSLQIIS